MICASMATLPERAALLERAVGSLLPQVDRLHVYLDGHFDVPACLNDARVVFVHGRDAGNHKGNGKFYWGDALGSGYHLTVDDDIVYPDNYVATMCAAVDRHHRRAVVGVLGMRFHAPLVSYHRSRTAYAISMPLPVDVPVHAVGTGTLAHHTDAIRFTVADFPKRFASDAQAAVAAKRAGVPMIAVARSASWLVPMPTPGFSIYGIYDTTGDDTVKTSVIRGAAPWPVLPAIPDSVHEAIQVHYRQIGASG